jgi:hypothetical protein
MCVAIASGVHVVTMSSGFARTRVALPGRFLYCLASFLLVCGISALAHDHHGPPARIITDEQVGPWTISVWAQQHMDTGRFFVQVRPSSGTTVPDDLKVEIGVQPASQSSPVIFYPASREAPDGQYTAEAPFDAEHSWQVRVRLESARGVNETTTYLGASPPGSGEWQLLLYLVPFLSVGGLWFRVHWLRRGVRRRLAIQSLRPQSS